MTISSFVFIVFPSLSLSTRLGNFAYSAKISSTQLVEVPTRPVGNAQPG